MVVIKLGNFNMILTWLEKGVVFPYHSISLSISFIIRIHTVPYVQSCCVYMIPNDMKVVKCIRYCSNHSADIGSFLCCPTSFCRVILAGSWEGSGWETSCALYLNLLGVFSVHPCGSVGQQELEILVSLLWRIQMVSPTACTEVCAGTNKATAVASSVVEVMWATEPSAEGASSQPGEEFAVHRFPDCLHIGCPVFLAVPR